jgi:hypothetical protein
MVGFEIVVDYLEQNVDGQVVANETVLMKLVDCHLWEEVVEKETVLVKLVDCLLEEVVAQEIDLVEEFVDYH